MGALKTVQFYLELHKKCGDKCNSVSGVKANNFQKYLADKIESVKKSLSGNRTLPFFSCNRGVKLDKFAEIDEDEVIQTIEKLPNKQCALDPVPTWLFEKDF